MRAEPIEETTDEREEETARVDEPTRVRFDDPEWDDEFCTWLDNGLRTCCG